MKLQENRVFSLLVSFSCILVMLVMIPLSIALAVIENHTDSSELEDTKLAYPIPNEVSK